MKKIIHKQNKNFCLNYHIFNEFNYAFCNNCLQPVTGIYRNQILLSQNKGKSPPGCLRSPGIG